MVRADESGQRVAGVSQAVIHGHRELARLYREQGLRRSAEFERQLVRMYQDATRRGPSPSPLVEQDARGAPVRVRRARIGAAVGFFIHGAALGTWAPRIPSVQEKTGLDEGSLGIALTGLAVGMLAGTALARHLVRRFGSASTLRLSTGALLASLLGPALAPDLATLTLALTFLGATAGVADVAVNTQAVEVEQRYGRPVMSTFHGLFNVGGLIGAAVAAMAAMGGIGPAVQFGAVALVLAIVGRVAFRNLLSSPAERRDARTARDTREAAHRPPRRVTVVLLGVIGFASFVGEGAAADWSAVYLDRTVGTSPGLAAAGFAAFSLAMAATRFVADRLTFRFGPVAVVRVGGIVAAFGLGQALVLLSPGAAIIGFAMMGAGLSAVVPIAFSAAGNLGQRQGLELNQVIVMSYLGAVVGPLVIGLLADAVGLRVALGLVVAFAATISILAPRVASARVAAP